MGAAALAAVGLVDDDGEALVAEVGDAFDDVGEFLDGGDDDLFAVFQGRFQIRRAQRRGDDVLDLGEVLDVVAQLFVEQAAVGDDDDAVEQRLIQSFGAWDVRSGRVGFDELIGGPGDGVRLARTG
jgi:hypothetical protein